MANTSPATSSPSPSHALLRADAQQQYHQNDVEKTSASVTSVAVPLQGHQTGLEKWIDWGIKVFGFAAAITFGIWAPLSYDATASGNVKSDASQQSVMQMQSSMLSAQQAVITAQSSLADAQYSIIGQLSAIGQMSAINFCLANSDYGPCRSAAFVTDLPSILSYLGGVSTATATGSDGTATSTSRVTATPSSGITQYGAGRSSHNMTGAIIGGVFGGIAFILILLGPLVIWKKRGTLKARE